MKLKKLLSLVAVGMLATQLPAQQFVPCATDEYMEQLRNMHPESRQYEHDFNESISILQQVQSITQNKRGKVLYVPVVFHIIHQNGLENITQAQIMDQLRIVNEDFRKKQGTNGFSTDPLAADMEIEFRLAQYDPNGNKHDGINRVFSTLTTSANENVKALSFWDSRRYLNVWIVSSISLNTGLPGTVLGFAQLPTQLNFAPTTDGIVMRADQVGVIGLGQVSQAGRTFTHEVGHWLNLFHPFQSGCGSGSITTLNCASTGDFVCDTPPVKEANYGCNTNANSCINDIPDLPDLIRNYMDYSNGTCMNMFTQGQKIRVNAALPLRSQIFGIADNNFTQNLNYAGIDVTTGGYSEVPAAGIKAPYFYGFEGNSLLFDGWKINNFNNPSNGFAVSSIARLQGSSSISMLNFDNPTGLLNARDGFQSPEIDLTTVASPYLTFYYAYAQRSFATNDQFVVRISNNFGMEEAVLFDKLGSALASAPTTAESFVPDDNQWEKVSVDLSAYKHFRNARVRFEFINRRGNNVFVDNFFITDGPTSVAERLKSNMKFTAYPNPAKDATEISFELERTQHVTITLVDLVGKEMIHISNGQINAGTHQYKVSTVGLPKGMYLIRVSADEHRFSHKLLVN
jgi:hypothetical protein